MRNASLLATFVVATWIGASAKAEIVFTGGSADIVFYYESAKETWHTAFWEKGSTVASGLDNPFAGFTGLNSGDYSSAFDLSSGLTMKSRLSQTVGVGATNYLITSASGSPLLSDGSTPDLGIRIRLRENEVDLGIGSGTSVNQFDGFRMTLNPTASTFNGSSLDGAGAHVALLHWDPVTGDPVALIDTASGIFGDTTTGVFPNFAASGHVHRNWGFSRLGEYSLVFDIDGVGGNYAGAPTGQFAFNVTAVPEPATTGLLAAGFGCVALGRRFRRKKSISESAKQDDLAVVS